MKRLGNVEGPAGGLDGWRSPYGHTPYVRHYARTEDG